MAYLGGPYRAVDYGTPESKAIAIYLHNRHGLKARLRAKEEGTRDRSWLDVKDSQKDQKEKRKKRKGDPRTYIPLGERARGISIQIGSNDIPIILSKHDESTKNYSTQSNKTFSREEQRARNPALPEEYACLSLLRIGEEGKKQAYKILLGIDAESQRRIYQLLLEIEEGGEKQLYQLISEMVKSNPNKVYEVIDGMSEKEQTRVYGAMLRMGRQGKNTIDNIFGLQALPRKPKGTMSVDEVTIVDDETGRFQSRQVLNGNFRDYKNDPFRGSHVDEHWISNEKTISRIFL